MHGAHCNIACAGAQPQRQPHQLEACHFYAVAVPQRNEVGRCRRIGPRLGCRLLLGLLRGPVRQLPGLQLWCGKADGQQNTPQGRLPPFAVLLLGQRQRPCRAAGSGEGAG